MPVVTRNDCQRARGPRVNPLGQGRVGQDAGGPPLGKNPNLDQVLNAINNLIGVVHQRLPPPRQQDAGGHGANIRERSRIPPPRLAKDQGEASIHQAEPPPTLEQALVREP